MTSLGGTAGKPMPISGKGVTENTDKCLGPLGGEEGKSKMLHQMKGSLPRKKGPHIKFPCYRQIEATPVRGKSLSCHDTQKRVEASNSRPL